MRTAKEAREHADSLANKTNKYQLEEIENKIEEAINNSPPKYEIWVYSRINTAVKKYLESLSYEVREFDDQRDGYSVKISW
jgi:lipocalin